MSKYTAEQVLYAAQLEEDTYDGDLIIVQYLRDYATLLREHEAAKAAVTDEMIECAARAMQRKFDPSSSLEDMTANGKWRRFVDEAKCCLEAVAPMLTSARSVEAPAWPGYSQGEPPPKDWTRMDVNNLTSARVPERTSDMTKFVDGLGWVVRLSDVPEYTKRLIEQTRDLLAAAPKPEAEEN